MPESRSGLMPREAAEAIAISALSFLAERPEDLRRFLDLAGLGPGNLRAAAADPGFLTGVIAFLLQHESLLVDFAAEASLPPTSVAAAGRILGAGN